ncbi:hypothetical protein F3Y22_tig00112758pilonHSYRG00023 [Hibiscus syriacus]|uniref:Uncharacterized protein n=1 Tax=Hibiscus syriacus TaxID=106335 RepID=A0A6A2XRD4_HIBSY|nr:hypothetical protein F3Y22_tig00112758pilonHSYRG00023 [Hibiscus syriacus]
MAAPEGVSLNTAGFLCVYKTEKIDIVTASMGHALATEEGFCTGSARVIDHQTQSNEYRTSGWYESIPKQVVRLSSSGYVFSASLPPCLASAAITAIDVLEENPDLTLKLKENIAILWKVALVYFIAQTRLRCLW